MTWTLTAQGHHTTNEWRNEEYDLLRKLVENFEAEGVYTSTFKFTGNYVSANSLAEAKEKLTEYDNKAAE